MFVALGLAPAEEASILNHLHREIKPISLGSYFDGFDGCFVLLTERDGEFSIYNREKSLSRISPCSTFKVVNSLIALETGVVPNEHTVYSWDGTKYPLAAWNRDLDMAAAIQVSAFWYYQILAEKIGPDRMVSYLRRLQYGNMDITGGMDHFWQQSTLKISPVEQVELLRNIFTYQTPFSAININILKKIILLDYTPLYTLYGKTGSGTQHEGFAFLPGDRNINGWFIGVLETKMDTYYFAINIASDTGATGMQAKKIGMAILEDCIMHTAANSVEN